MHSNIKRLSTSVLGVSLLTFAFAATSAQAATVSGVTVAEGDNGYNNVTVSATVGSVNGETLVFAAKDRAGTTLVSSEKAATEGTNSQVLDLSSLGDKNKVYYYEVSVKNASVAAGTWYANVGWGTNDFVKADATTSPATYVNGAWEGTAPTITDNAFQISTTQAVFNVSDNSKIDTSHQIVDFQCDANIDSCYLLDDITNDVTAAIGAMSLVTNDAESAAAYWMVLKEGKTWVAISGDAIPATTNKYTLRMEVDYGYDPAQIRYSVKPDGASVWTVLPVNNSEWVAASNNCVNVSKVCFAGKTAVSKFNAQLSTKNVAEANGTEYGSVTDAMAAAKTANKAFVLFTNVKVDPTTLVKGNYAFKANGKNFAVADHTWKVSDVSGKTVTIDGETLTVVEAPFIAKIGDDDETAAVYTVLGTALAAGSGETVVVLTNIAENATSTVDNVALDLNGFELTESVGTAPILVVKSGSLLLLGNENGGSIRGASADSSAIKVEGGAVYIDGIYVTNNTGKALYVVGGAKAVISNGVFKTNGAIATDDNVATRVDVLGGFYADTATLSGTNIVFTGAKVTDESKTAATGKLATGYDFTAFANSVTTNGLTFTYEVMPVVTNASGGTVVVKVYSVTNEQGEAVAGGVQIPDTWVKDATGKDPASAGEDAQAELAKPSKYPGVQKWQAYVLGMNGTDSATANEGPRAQAVQDTSTDTIGFKMWTPEMVKAAESGCKVEYQVEAYTDPEMKTQDVAGGSEKVNYDETAAVPNPSGVRYYKMKITITPKQ